MQELALHLLRPIAIHPDAIALNAIDGEAVTILEAIVHPDDAAMLEEDGGRTLRAVRNVLSAAAGRRKATLELVKAFSAEGAAEE